MSRSLVTALAALLLAASSSATAQQASHGRIEGDIRDSVHAAPLGGAVVLVTRLEPQPSEYLSTVTDPRGHFALENLSAGRYSVSFTSELLDSLQLSIPAREVRLGADEKVKIDFGVPSGRTLRMGACPGVSLPQGKGAIIGQVTDADTEQPLAGAEVTVLFTEIGLDKSTLKPAVHERMGAVKTGATGQYHVCGVPTDSYVLLQTQHGGRLGSPVRVIVGDEAGVLRRDLSLSASTARTVASVDSAGARSDSLPLPLLTGTATLTGTVRSSAGQPLANAQVKVLDAAPTTTTDSLGRFSLSRLPGGTQQLEVRRVGFQIARLPVELRSGRGVQQDVILPRFAQLDTMRVVAQRPRYNEAESRARVGAMGQFLGEAEIARQRPMLTSDLVRILPGFRIVGDGLDTKIVSRRGATSLQKSSCETNIVIDGVQHQDINLVSAGDVGAMESYSGPAGAPPQYESACGVIIISTRR